MAVTQVEEMSNERWQMLFGVGLAVILLVYIYLLPELLK